MNKKYLSAVILLLLNLNIVLAQKKYKPKWESLTNYEIPEWFKDVKFGIFIHWGPTTVPAHGAEWYGYNMWTEGEEETLGNPGTEPSGDYKYHVENFGKPEDFGYTKFIPMFKAEKFDSRWRTL